MIDAKKNTDRLAQIKDELVKLADEVWKMSTEYSNAYDDTPDGDQGAYVYCETSNYVSDIAVYLDSAITCIGDTLSNSEISHLK